jgi:chromosome segregation ATPase
MGCCEDAILAVNVDPSGADRITAVLDEDAEARFTRLEHEVTQLRERVALAMSDAAAARVLAAGADRDVSEVRAELRAHTQTLNALRETQVEQGRKIDRLEQKVDGLEQKVDGLEQKVDGLDREMRNGFATMATGMTQITALLTHIGGPEPDRN